MAQAVHAIDSYLHDMTEDTFLTSSMVSDAVVRNLEVISEASHRLSNELKERNPNIQWQSLADSGDMYQHDYAQLNDGLIWETATAGLDGLREMLRRERGA